MSERPRAGRPARLGSFTALLCVLTACGGGSKGTGSTSPASTAGPSSATASTGATTEAQTSSSPADGSCSATPAVTAAAKSFNEITKISLDGGCGLVTAATTLPPGALGSVSATRAITICNALTKVAYVGSVYGVSIEGTDGHELAASTKDHRECI